MSELTYIDGLDDFLKEADNFVLIGDGSGINKYDWDESGYCVCCSNMAWRRYKNRIDYVIVANEHLDFVLKRMPPEMRGKQKIIVVDNAMVKGHKITNQGSFTAFFHYLLKVFTGKEIVLQGVDFDSKEGRWGRYRGGMRLAWNQTKDRGHKVFTTSHIYIPHFAESFKIENI